MTLVMLGGFMRRILDVRLIKQYIKKHNIERKLDCEILKYAQLHFYRYRST